LAVTLCKKEPKPPRVRAAPAPAAAAPAAPAADAAPDEDELEAADALHAAVEFHEGIDADDDVDPPFPTEGGGSCGAAMPKRDLDKIDEVFVREGHVDVLEGKDWDDIVELALEKSLEHEPGPGEPDPKPSEPASSSGAHAIVVEEVGAPPCHTTRDNWYIGLIAGVELLVKMGAQWGNDPRPDYFSLVQHTLEDDRLCVSLVCWYNFAANQGQTVRVRDGKILTLVPMHDPVRVLRDPVVLFADTRVTNRRRDKTIRQPVPVWLARLQNMCDVALASAESVRVCEMCGEPGSVYACPICLVHLHIACGRKVRDSMDASGFNISPDVRRNVDALKHNMHGPFDRCDMCDPCRHIFVG